VTQLSERRVGWKAGEVKAWMDNKLAARSVVGRPHNQQARSNYTRDVAATRLGRHHWQTASPSRA
jgi:hypothetical protein